MSNIVTCRCQTCDGPIEFEDSYAGQTTPCPHCGIDTLLYAPESERPPQLKPEPRTAVPKRPRSNSWIFIVIGSCLALVFGLIGGFVSQTPDDDGKASKTPFIEGFFYGVIIFGICAVGLVIYFLPLIIAVSKRKKNAVAIALLNLFVGWTFIGWVISLVWAATED